MAECSYNGVKLQALPELPYEYSCINESALVPGVYTLYICSEPFYYSATEGNVRTAAGASLSTSQYDNDAGAWGEIENMDRIAGSTGLKPFWCNVDILNEDGSVYLAASRPVKIFDLRSFKTGLSFGLCGNALPWKADTILPSSCLLSFDGYVLQDVNGFNLRPKDSVLANYNDGPVYLATSAPVSVPTYDPTALLQGYLVGCRIRAMRRKPTEPDTPIAALFSADGYILKDSNGIYITVKEFC